MKRAGRPTVIKGAATVAALLLAALAGGAASAAPSASDAPADPFSTSRMTINGLSGCC